MFGMWSCSYIKVRSKMTYLVFLYWRTLADGSVLKSAQPGYYTDSILKFRLVFPSNYPDRPPAVQFLTDVFHPLISQEDGTFNLDSRFRPWRCVVSDQFCFLCSRSRAIASQTKGAPCVRCFTLGQGCLQEARAGRRERVGMPQQRSLQVCGECYIRSLILMHILLGCELSLRLQRGLCAEILIHR